jgi:predicted DNA-binding WGR domain protein
MCCIRETNGQWVVLAKWGRRGKKLSNQVKGTFSSETLAATAQWNLWKDRQKEGYLDIESSEYRDHMKAEGGSPLMLSSVGIQENLELADGFTPLGLAKSPTVWKCDRCGKDWQPKQNVAGWVESGQGDICPDCIQKVKEIAAAKRARGEDEVQVCVDNSGIEDRFDIGIEYLVENHADKGMVYVYDKLGRKDEYFRIRFVTPEQWAIKNGKIIVNIIKNRTADGNVPVFFQPKEGDTIRIIPPKSGTLPVRHFVGVPA